MRFSIQNRLVHYQFEKQEAFNLGTPILSEKTTDPSALSFSNTNKKGPKIAMVVTVDTAKENLEISTIDFLQEKRDHHAASWLYYFFKEWAKKRGIGPDISTCLKDKDIAVVIFKVEHFADERCEFVLPIRIKETLWQSFEKCGIFKCGDEKDYKLAIPRGGSECEGFRVAF